MDEEGLLLPCSGVGQWAPAMLYVPFSSLPLPRGSFPLKNPQKCPYLEGQLAGMRWDPVNPSSLNKGINQSRVKHYDRNINSGWLQPSPLLAPRHPARSPVFI